jgi:hypothetical protein
MNQNLLLLVMLIIPLLMACSGASTEERMDPAPPIPVEASLSSLTAAGVAGLPAAQVANLIDGDTIDRLFEGPRYRMRYVLLYTPSSGQPGHRVDLAGPAAGADNREPPDGPAALPEKDSFETNRYARLRFVNGGSFLVNKELLRLGLGQAATLLTMLVLLILYRFPK